MGASKGYIAAHPKVPEAITKAIDEAARIIHDDPRRAAEIYLVHEPSRTLDAAALAGVLSGLRDEFGGAQIAARKLEGDRRAGAVEFAGQLMVRTGFADRALTCDIA